MHKSLQKMGKRKKEIVPEEIIPAPPGRKSILKKKFLDKTLIAPKTPQFHSFDFDERSPISEQSWMKNNGLKNKKRAAGFKTKKQKQEDQRAATRKRKDEKKADAPPKVLYSKFLLSYSI